MRPNITGFSTLRARSYVFRLPLFTRLVLVAIVGFWLAGLVPGFDIKKWGALIPDEMGIATLYRMNTFPFIHLNIFHAIMNALAIAPLLERFEGEYGTLVCLALFFGPLTTLPAFLYVGVEKFLVGGNVSVMGASMWVFVLLGMEAMRTSKHNPKFVIGTWSIPTWTTPIAILLATAALVPSSSFLGHLCGLVVGYVSALGLLKYLAPPEKILRWIEGKLNLLGRLPHYVSVDQKTYGRFGVLPSTNNTAAAGVPLGIVGGGQRLGP
ncbi:putative rhomboid protein 2 [Podospora australis]|uniref:rhomboid protease n=1 Tax=Podospora australis TaxID=1536484 RepID=A0AAN6WUD4_9PEZI|nr:putative rhomboid protein 2 [Podospora australis]